MSDDLRVGGDIERHGVDGLEEGAGVVASREVFQGVSALARIHWAGQWRAVVYQCDFEQITRRK